MGFGRGVLGVAPLMVAVNGGSTPTTSTLPTVNNAVSFRFQAEKARSISYVWINWASVTSPGTVRIRVETDNGSGKPSGTLYDPNAQIDITPTAGWQQCVFATAPTTNTTVGVLYHIVVITTVAGSTQSLRSFWTVTPGGGYPANCLTATDGSTRTNFTENSNSVPACTLGLSDGTTTTEEPIGFAPFAASSNFAVYGTRALATKLTVPTGVTLSLTGITLELPLRSGTPDELRVRIFNGTTLVGSALYINRVGITGASGRRIRQSFASPVSLPAGTYRVVVDQSNAGATSSTTSGNAWTFYHPVFRTSALAPSYLALSTTTDITAGTPTWTDDATAVPLIGLEIDDISASGGSGTVPAASDVRLGVAVGAGTGTLALPAAGNVLTGVSYGAAGTEFSGALTLPASNLVVLGTVYGVGGNSLTGAVTVPSANNVRSGTTFGASLGSTGNMTLPAIGDVASGISYGTNGTQYTGTLSGGGGMTLSQLQTELNTRGITALWAAAVPANIIQLNGVVVASSDGVAQAGAASTITLASTDSAVANAYLYRVITIVAGTGKGQSRYITAYNSTTKVATVNRAWDTVPDATSVYVVDPTSENPSAGGGSSAPTVLEISAQMERSGGVLDLANTRIQKALPDAVPSATGGLPLKSDLDGRPVNVTQWGGANITTPDIAGHPKVTISDGSGQGQLDLTSGMVRVDSTSNDAIDADSISATAAAKIAQAVVDLGGSGGGGNSVQVRPGTLLVSVVPASGAPAALQDILLSVGDDSWIEARVIDVNGAYVPLDGYTITGALTGAGGYSQTLGSTEISKVTESNGANIDGRFRFRAHGDLTALARRNVLLTVTLTGSNTRLAKARIQVEA
jgi:hypothetical protein